MKTTILALLSALPAFAAFPDICTRCWYEVPNSHLDDVRMSPTPPGYGGDDAIMAWSGGAFDSRRNRLILAGGGGGSDYGGNEVYAFDVDSLKWFRIKDAVGGYDDSDAISPYYFNGGSTPDEQQPRPAYNFDQVEYDSTSDNLYLFGLPATYPNSHGWPNILQLHMSTLHWSSPAEVSPDIAGAALTAQDPATGKIWIFSNGDESWTEDFDPSNNEVTDHGDMWSEPAINYNKTAAVMPSVNRMISMGDGGAEAWDLVSSGATAHEDLETSGCDSLINVDAPGFAWDPVQRKMIGWAGGTHVYAMDSTYTCTDIAPGAGNSVTRMRRSFTAPMGAGGTCRNTTCSWW